ncbi:hypothetical protein G647_04500 [Cladophialophora carrionii CBS 160.54]|uniref:Transcriptional regulator n=1 Tax=Cladophialophora carrionii CBS 160.54 TaxID=1279043 RepID=V9DFM3_9EURO|nr:uncharacterized protein G647_04500 [Cladophialophora carrionii CBS 160.54]ETI25128.1 hypothetical protein G647_04500 [Cladophialophora carrionii CBS 160.54]
MSSSETELSEVSKTPTPPHHELENSLRRAVIKAQKDEVDFSYKYIRTAAEGELGLTPGFFKSHEKWNQLSKQVIEEQMEAGPESHSPPPKPKAAESRNKPAKRKSAEREPAPKKRQKITKQAVDPDGSEDLSSPPSGLASEFEEGEDEQPKKKQRNAPAKARATKSKPVKGRNIKAAISEDEEDDKEEDENGATKADSPEAAVETRPAGKPADADASDSELSVLIDEKPPPKKRKQKDSSGSKPNKTTTKSSTKAKPEAEDPDQAEIKRLQGWLVKCGIRKLWGKELKPYETPKAKIKHLKSMLADVGMTGRYSLEKANQIKEARELAADIEAVQEGAERWGAVEDEDGGRGEKDVDSRPQPGARRLVRGARNYDFLSSDGEETD